MLFTARSVIILVAFCLTSSAAANVVSEEENRTVVVLFGDSISVGFGEVVRIRTWSGQAFAGTPSQELTNIMNDSDRPAVVPNRGIGGSPTGREANGGSGDIAGAARVRRDLRASKSQFPGTQHIVLILYGTNDFNFGISQADTGFNTRVMISRARGEGYTPVVATLLRRADRDVTGYNSFIRGAAASEQAPLVDMYDLFNNAGGLSLLFDEVHPTEIGYRIIAQLWFEHYLEAAIEPTRRGASIMQILELLLLDD